MSRLLRFAFVVAVLVPLAASPVQAARVPTLEWGGSAHANTDTLSQWLDARGARYTVWAQRHPSASAWLEGKSLVISAPRRGPARAAIPATTEPHRSHLLVGVVAALGGSLLVAASALSLPSLRVRYGSRAAARQFSLVAAGGGLIVSVAVGYGLTLF